MLKSFSQFIREQFTLAYFNRSSGIPIQVVVYKNPISLEDMKDLFFQILNNKDNPEKEVRFLAIPKGKKFFFWDASKDVHYNTLLKVSKSSTMQEYQDFTKMICGIATLEGSGETATLVYKTMNREKTSFDEIAANYRSNTPIPQFYSYKSAKEIKDNLEMLKFRFKFVEDYVKGFNQNGIFARLEKLLK